MSTEPNILHHQFEQFLWIRCKSRGSFMNSPTIKSLADHYIAQGGNHIIVDLELCSGVDSTFMGTLAGIARQCMTMGGGVEIASPTSRTLSAMMNLGLDALLSIDPEDAPWQSNLSSIREAVEQQNSDEAALHPDAKSLSEIDRTKHVLDAHTVLRNLNEKNEESFGYVCTNLEDDLARRSESST